MSINFIQTPTVGKNSAKWGELVPIKLANCMFSSKIPSKYRLTKGLEPVAKLKLTT
jgi:hypothetical protein